MIASTMIALCTLSAFAFFTAVSGIHDIQEGLDISSPMHHPIQDKSSIFAKRYERTMDECSAAYSREECESTETSRLKHNRNQPKSQHNYTEVGFLKTRVPDSVWGDIQAFYEENKDKEVEEPLPRAKTFFNSWVSPTQMVSFDDPVSHILFIYEYRKFRVHHHIIFICTHDNRLHV